MLSYKKALYFTKRSIYFILPVVLLYVIFKRVDFDQLFIRLEKTLPLYILLGISLRPLQIIIGAVRWRLMNNYYCNTKLPFSYMITRYWSGLAIGFFTPGSFGWDAYRVMAVGKKLKTYTSAVIAVFAEKFIGLFSILFMFLIMFPVVVNSIQGDSYIYKKIYFICILGMLIAIVFTRIIIKLNIHNFTSAFQSVFDRFILKIISTLKNKKISNIIYKEYNHSKRIKLIFQRPKLLINSFLLSIGILLIAAVCSQLIFIGLEYKISFAINLFAAPVLFVLFIIPISFGSLGVREGSFILLYGQFGVPLETALLVSFFNLLGLILNNIIGVVFFLLQGIKSEQKTY